MTKTPISTDNADYANSVPVIQTAPRLNRASMLARPWQRIKFFSRWASDPDSAVSPGRQRSNEHHTDPIANMYEWQQDGRMRRAALLVVTLLQTALAGVLMSDSLPSHGSTMLEHAIMALFLILFFWVSAGFWTAIAGFIVLMCGGDRHSITRTSHLQKNAASTAGHERTAVVMPICNEDVARVFAGLRATYESLASCAGASQFDFYVLSDSNDSDVCTAELGAWSALCTAVNGFHRIFYRRRHRRVNRKSGNIADFCRRWGKNYRFMVILDADSVMSGECLTTLVELMEANPRAGIIQTAPRVAGRDTLYARIQQFAACAYSPLFTAGLHFWQLGESHYWGHNAIIRIAPFMRHCALAPLPGQGPLSGEILSHDFIEAALMRRAGWTVWVAYDLPGSYEEIPPNLLDELQRDRRWCRGNMMNFRLILERGIHPVYRAVFAIGIMAYASSLLWLAFLIFSSILLAVSHSSPVDASALQASVTQSLGPVNPQPTLQLFVVTASLLMLPKILAIAHICLRGAHQYGGVARLIMSTLFEMLFSILAAPSRMLFHCQFVIEAFTGRTLQWKSPSRNDTETTWREAMLRHGPHTALGAIWITAVYLASPASLIWLLPVLGSLMLSIPLSVLSSRVSLGQQLRKMRILLTPEEHRPPRELCATVIYHGNADSLPGFEEAVVDPSVNALVIACGKRCTSLPTRTKADRLKLLQSALHNGPKFLSSSQKRILFNDPLTLLQLHLDVWKSVHAHPHWRDLIAGRSWLTNHLTFHPGLDLLEMADREEAAV